MKKSHLLYILFLYLASQPVATQCQILPPVDITPSSPYFTYMGISYLITDPDAKTCKTTGFGTFNKVGNLSIPEKALYNDEEYTVTAIGENTFRTNYDLTGITLPETITEIESGAFYECVNLSGELQIPEGVVTIGTGAFANCGSIMGELRLPVKIESIGDMAFSMCMGLEGTLVIPSEVSAIGAGAFSGCIGITDFVIEENNPFFSSEGGALYNFDGTTLLSYPSARSWVTVPDYVKTIGDSAFFGCCELTEVTLPSGLNYIGDSAFMLCSSLASIEIPSGVKYLGEQCFRNCTSLVDVNLSEGIELIPGMAFTGCHSLKTIDIPQGVTNIGGMSFVDCPSLREVTFPTTLKEIGYSAFAGCPLGSLDFPEGLEKISQEAFVNCYLLENLVLPESLTSIGLAAFESCSSLLTIDIGSNLEVIYDFAFNHSYNINTIKCRAVIPPECIPYSFGGKDIPINEFFSYDVYSDANLYVPENSIEAYRESPPVWSRFLNILPLEGGSTGIDEVSTDSTHIVIYNIQGVRMGGDINALSPGIYIINGKKVVIR